MKSSHILTLSIGSMAIATGIYLAYPHVPSENMVPSTNTQSKVSNIVGNSQQNMWDILNQAMERADRNRQALPSDRDQLIAVVEQNPTLKMRIQGMSWYRDFLLGKIQADDIRRDIADAILLEGALKADPSLLMRIQHREIWRQYLS
jgi:hypothetical protein